ncbi:MAG: alpha/beta fold hydrolase [Kiloniellales bacterium]
MATNPRPEADYEVFSLGDVRLQSGAVLPDARLAFKTYGRLNAAKDNVVVIPTYYTGKHNFNEPYFGPGKALDPARHFIISPDLFGNGLSSSPSNTAPPLDGPRFPRTTLHDNVACQHRLLSEVFGIERIALVMGWSMAALQSYQWAAQYPTMVANILPFCGSAKCSAHNFVFLDGVRVTLQADGAWACGDYDTPPEVGLRAFGRVYAGWAFSQTFYREGHYRTLGFETVEDLLVDWEEDHLNWDANDLLAMLWSWQHGDISDNELYGGDLRRALGAIEARVIVAPCSTDLYFPPEDNAIEVSMLRDAELRVFDSPFGHCVATPGRHEDFVAFLDGAIRDLLDRG